MSNRQELLVIVGPTGVGKSELAIRAARLLGGEVISADSMQVYRYFDIGSGKLEIDKRLGVSHHLIDIVEPDDRFSAARFVAEADRAIRKIAMRGLLPIVVGGTGLYVKALLFGLFDAPRQDPAIRREHLRIRNEGCLQLLYSRLRVVDPDAADRIRPTDFIRISRALEVFEQTGATISSLRRVHGFSRSRYDARCLGIRPDRTDLRQRIDCRVDEMMRRGWLSEVRTLIDRGYGATHPMGALGYRGLSAALCGKLNVDEAVRQTKRDTWRFAKRQLNWFGADDSISWFPDSCAVTERALAG